MTPDYCEIRNNDFLTLPTHHHLALVSSLSTKLKFLHLAVNTSLDKMDIVSDKLKFLTYLNDLQVTPNLNSMLPFHLSEAVVLPLYDIPAAALVVCTLVIAWCISKSMQGTGTCLTVQGCIHY